MSERQETDFTQQLADALKHLREQGFEPPFVFTLVATNGSTVSGMYRSDQHNDALIAEILDSNIEGSGFSLPIKLTIVDRRGHAARFPIDLSHPQQRLN